MVTRDPPPRQHLSESWFQAPSGEICNNWGGGVWTVYYSFVNIDLEIDSGLGLVFMFHMSL